tara:strand:- start:1523 stop:2005 length:483 start_codon:yes stop_codon:yes gene_type:complete
MPLIYESSEKNDIETPLRIVIECVKLLNINDNDYVLDCCSGLNNIWLDNINCKNKDYCEIKLNKDFLTYQNNNIDWIVGNLPFNLFSKFFKKIIDLNVNKGIGIICLEHSITPSRIIILKSKGFYIKYIRKLKIKEWKFGFNVCFFVFTKDKNSFCEVLQ